MGAREDIAAALNGVAGIKVSPFYRQSLKAGDGFVRLASRAPDSAFHTRSVDTWEVWLAVPQDFAAAERWFDAHLNEVINAFRTEATFISATPSELVLTGGAVNGVIITGTAGA